MMKWKLTKREGVLLFVFFMLVIGYGYYRFLIIPQSQTLEAFHQDVAYYQQEAKRKIQSLEMEDELYDKKVNLEQETQKIKDSFFSELEQEDLLILFNQFVENSGLDISNITFSEPKIEQIGELSFEISSMSFPFKGQYEEIMILMKDFSEYKKQIVVNDLRISSQEGEELEGNMVVDFYSLPHTEENEAVLFSWQKGKGANKSDPFVPYSGYGVTGEDTNMYDWKDVSNVQITFGPSKTLLEGFESKNLSFGLSTPQGKGRMTQNINRKEGNYSLRLEYELPMTKEDQYVYISLENEDIYLDHVPQKIGLWVYAYETSSHGIEGRIKDQNGNEYAIIFTNQINWTGWKHLEISPNWKKAQYPIQVTKLLVTGDSQSQPKGVILLDGLEISNSVDALSEPDMYMTGGFIHYEVQSGDTLKQISQKFYQSPGYVNTIMKYNGLTSSQNLKPGEYLVLPEKPK